MKLFIINWDDTDWDQYSHYIVAAHDLATAKDIAIADQKQRGCFVGRDRYEEFCALPDEIAYVGERTDPHVILADIT